MRLHSYGLTGGSPAVVEQKYRYSETSTDLAAWEVREIEGILETKGMDRLGLFGNYAYGDLRDRRVCKRLRPC